MSVEVVRDKKLISFAGTAHDHTNCVRAAKRLGVSVSELLRSALAEYLWRRGLVAIENEPDEGE
jgi:hypothetical protein